MSMHTQFRPDQVADDVFLAPGAVILGDVTIGEQSSVWYQAVIRGDCEAVRIGRQTNIQDGCILHAEDVPQPAERSSCYGKGTTDG